MFIQTGSAKFYFASALAQILNSFQNLLPIVYIKEREKVDFVLAQKYTWNRDANIYVIYIIGNFVWMQRRYIQAKLMFIQTVMPLFITNLR
mgnify:CR=1 FL=1